MYKTVKDFKTSFLTDIAAANVYIMKKTRGLYHVYERRYFNFTPGLFSEIVAIQGGALNRGLIRFFSIYRPSCHIEAYIRPEKNCFVWAGPLANHPFNFNFIFLSDGTTAAAERAVCFADLNRRFPVPFRSDGRT